MEYVVRGLKKGKKDKILGWITATNYKHATKRLAQSGSCLETPLGQRYKRYELYETSDEE